jgi:NAD(P)-dependent dehydrogenase (short-subunit alcohol dehydrogenase family)
MRNQKVWFITGASQGMGLEVARAVLANGDKVVATSRSMEELVRNLGQANEHYLPLLLNITNEQQAKQTVAESINTFGTIDVVLNNAGYYLVGSLEEISDGELRRSMDVNLFGTANVIRSVLPYLRDKKRGYIINIASYLGYVGFANTGAYNAGKFAMIGLSEALAQEVKPFGIDVTVVAPGMFRTNFLSGSTLAVTKHKIDDYNVSKHEKMLSSFDGHQPGDPKKLAQVLLKLADLSEPPLHIALGTDSYNAIVDHRQKQTQEMEQWKHLTLSTDFA